MADSTTILDLISVGQANKEDTANALYDALSPAALWGRRASTCVGLTWGYYGGRFESAPIANATIMLGDATTNYLVAARSDGAVSVSSAATNWDDTDNYIRLYKIVTASSLVVSYEDHRQAIWPWDGSGGGGGDGVAAFYELDGSGSADLEYVDFEPTSLDY